MIKPPTLVYESVLSTILIYLLFYLPLTQPYLLLINEHQQPGDVIFNASVYKLGSERHYKISVQRSAPFVSSLIQVDPKDGTVYLLENLQCNSPYYPNLFTAHIDSTSNRLRDIDYYSLPLRIFIVGKDCDKRQEDDVTFLGRRRRRSNLPPTHESLTLGDGYRKLTLRLLFLLQTDGRKFAFESHSTSTQFVHSCRKL